MTDHVEIAGYVATTITVIYTCFGLPVQIVKNSRSKSTEGISLVMMLMTFCTFTSWVTYGAVKPQPDWFVIVSNAPGSVCILIILVQFYLYRETPKGIAS